MRRATIVVPYRNANLVFDATRQHRGVPLKLDNCHFILLRDALRDQITVGGAGGGDDDNDSQGGVGILYNNLTSSSSALQGLLRKLGARLDGLLPSSAMGLASSSHRSGRLKKILAGLRENGEEGK
ncbi:hypothetical protein BC332_31920 [Capsicum chinense]|nr:hypothetical protein BC332_31920 [Capsicum chinense]